MPTITIDDKEYDLDLLSDEIKNQIGNLQFVEAEFHRLNALAAVVQTARVAYTKALSEALAAHETPK